MPPIPVAVMTFQRLQDERDMLELQLEKAEEMYANVFSKWSNAVRAAQPQEFMDSLEVQSVKMWRKSNRTSAKLNKCKTELNKRKCERISMGYKN